MEDVAEILSEITHRPMECLSLGHCYVVLVAFITLCVYIKNSCRFVMSGTPVWLNTTATSAFSAMSAPFASLVS